MNEVRTESNTVRVAIVGAGNVGSTFAYALLQSGLSPEIVMIDIDRKKAEGEVMDLNHSVPFYSPTQIWAGDYPDCAGSLLTVVAAGTAQKEGETRLDLLKRNAEIFQQIIPKVVENNPDGLLLIATNPVDILTYASWRYSGLDSSRVIGSGTILDTARFRYLLSDHLKVDSRSCHAHIIGEHGDSEVPVWSLANVAGIRLNEYCGTHHVECSEQCRQEIFERTRDAAYHIISRKGATYYAVAAGLMRIVESIARNQNTVLSVSSLIEDYYDISDVCLSLPSVLNRKGIRQVLRLSLDDKEIDLLKKSADTLKSTLKQLDLP